jgi:hypothetical protein
MKMQRIINALALKKNVAPCFFEYIGTQDESKTVGKVLHMFNILDPNHPNFKSTIVHMEDA